MPGVWRAAPVGHRQHPDPRACSSAASCWLVGTGLRGSVVQPRLTSCDVIRPVGMGPLRSARATAPCEQLSGEDPVMVSTEGWAGLQELGDETWSVLERLARALHVRNAELQPTLDGIVSTAVRTIGSAQYAGLILLVRGELVPQATAGEPPHVLDVLQHELGTGPCISAAREQVVVRVDELGTDQRWPTLAERAIPVGVASMLCVPLCVDQSRLGALSLYSEQPNAFSEPDLQLTGLFATHAALALSEAQRTAQLQDALRNRDLIGQAKGILMERSQVTADEAFRHLSQVSQSANLKLTAVAQHLIDTGELVGNHAT